MSTLSIFDDGDADQSVSLRRDSDGFALMRAGKDHADAQMMRRIAAAWNACSGISTEALEKGRLSDAFEQAESRADAAERELEETRADLGRVMDYARRLERIHVSDAEVIHNHVCAMRAAVIASDLNNAVAGMRWIRNTLAGPGFMPDSAAALAAAGGDVAEAPQVHFDAEMTAERTRRAGLPDPLPIAEPNAHTIQQSVLALAAVARDVGYEIRVYQMPLQPLAQGNHSTRVSVYENHAARKAREAREAADKSTREGAPS